MNLGGFRSYDAAPDANASDLIAVNQESAVSPVTARPAAISAEESTVEPPNESIPEVSPESKEEMPPPRKKLTIKLGGARKASSSQGSPE